MLTHLSVSQSVQAAAERLDLLLGWAREVCACSGRGVPPLRDLAGSFATAERSATSCAALPHASPPTVSLFYNISRLQGRLARSQKAIEHSLAVSAKTGPEHMPVPGGVPWP